MDDSKEKGKEKQEANREDAEESMNIISHDQTLPPSSSSSSSSTMQQQQQQIPSLDLNLPPPPSTSTTDHQPSSSSSTTPELIQEAKRLKLTLHDHQPDSSSTEPATSSDSGSIQAGAAQQEEEPHSNPALLRILLPEERSRGLFRLARQRASLRKEYKVFPVRVTRTPPGPSPLGPGRMSPYEIVKDVLSEMKQFLNNYSAFRASMKPNQPPKPLPFPASQILSTDATSSVAPLALAAASSSGPLSLEEVIVMLNEYVEGISKTVSAQEMEDRLQEFQRRVGIVDMDPDESSWYGLMKNSTSHFWEKMTDHFVCETIESDEDYDGGEDTTDDE